MPSPRLPLNETVIMTGYIIHSVATPALGASGCDLWVWSVAAVSGCGHWVGH